MHPTTLSVLVLAVVALAIGNLSAEPNIHLKWSDQNEEGSVDLYRQFYLYLGAVLSDGIPALQVEPLDPYNLGSGVQITETYNPNYPNYTDMETDINSLYLSGFSFFDVPTAELNLDEMLANLSISNSVVVMIGGDVAVSVLNSDGRLLQYNCTQVLTAVWDNLFTSIKQLELDSNQLQVKQFSLHYTADEVTSLVVPTMCTGDDELQDYLRDTLVEAQRLVTYRLIPDLLQMFSQTVTTVLNDIFALRNVTDDVSFDKPTEQKRQKNLHELPESENHSKRFVRRSSDQKSTERSRDDIKMTWSFN